MEKGLKITPQRVAILDAILRLNNHPTAEKIIEFIHENHPNIATGTVYKVLEVLTQRRLIEKVKTEKDVMRYEAIMENHHHLYCADSGRIEDYFDHELHDLIERYFQQKQIPGFEIDHIRLQINGKFKKNV
jgi:Fur family peroxide stress response transcriptional regulator